MTGSINQTTAWMNSPATAVQLEDAPCPMGCARDDTVVLSGRDRLHDLPGEFTVVRCNTCSLLRTNPRPTADTIGYYYPSDYAPYHTPTSAASPRRKPLNWRRRIQAWFNDKLGLVDAKLLPIEPPGKLLEIGCANGNYLRQAAALGWTTKGIEFDAAAATRARAAGLEVDYTSVEGFVAPGQSYDMIAGWMVFEHVHQPVDTFARLAQWIKPDGWLVFSVPDASALEFKLFGPRWYALQVPGHMTHFTPASIAAALQKSGWRLRRIIWHRNPNNLLHSLRYWALDKGHEKLAQYCADMVAGKRARRLHRRLGKWLALCKQSGRMTIWAQPVSNRR